MENPRMEWVQKSGKSCLIFTFQGSFREQDVQTAGENYSHLGLSGHEGL
jgi:hypothetical protein